MLEYLGVLNGLFPFGGGVGAAAAAAGGSDSSLSFAPSSSAMGAGAGSQWPDFDSILGLDLSDASTSMATDLLASGDKAATAGKLYIN